jgi:hypothetical protein
MALLHTRKRLFRHETEVRHSCSIWGDCIKANLCVIFTRKFILGVLFCWIYSYVVVSLLLRDVLTDVAIHDQSRIDWTYRPRSKWAGRPEQNFCLVFILLRRQEWNLELHSAFIQSAIESKSLSRDRI